MERQSLNPINFQSVTTSRDRIDVSGSYYLMAHVPINDTIDFDSFSNCQCIHVCLLLQTMYTFHKVVTTAVIFRYLTHKKGV